MQEPTKPPIRFTDRLKQKKVFLPVLALLFFVILLFVGIHIASNYAESTFVELANRELGPHSEIIYDDFHVGIFPIKASVTNLRVNHLTPISERTPQDPGDAIRHFHADRIELRKLNIYRLIREDHWGIGSLTVDGVELELTLPSTDRIKRERSESELPFTFSIGDIAMNLISTELYRVRNGDAPSWKIQNADLHIGQFNTHNAKAGGYDIFDTITAKAELIKHRTKDGYYEHTAESIQLNSLEQYFSLSRFSMKPLISTYDLAVQEQYATDSFTIESGLIRVDGFDIQKWFQNDEIRASNINLNELSLVIAREKTFPREPREDRTLPHADFAGLPFHVDIDSISWKKGFVSYTEQYSDVEKEGTLTFSDIDLVMHSLQNHTNPNPILAKASARFMESSDLDLDFEFYATPLASHSISGKLSSMDLTAINHPLEGLAAAKVQEGHLTSLDFSFRANDYESNGELTIIYNDLNIKLLDSDTFEEGTRTKIKSFLVNTFAVREDNPTDEPRVGAIEFERDKERSMFNFWWKSIQSGLMESVKP